MRAYRLETGEILYPRPQYAAGVVADGMDIAFPGDAAFDEWASRAEPLPASWRAHAEDMRAVARAERGLPPLPLTGGK
jgi:hypothetical protein